MSNIDRVNISNGAIERNLQTYAVGDNRATGQPKQTSTSNDEVNLSSAAKDAERLANLADQSRTDRLEAVRLAIANGTYQVSGEDIAKKLIELNTR
jgi:negative regulator of flagellin synthesis FlgM